jgi:hypothetical protein
MAYKSGLQSQQNVFRKQFNDSYSALWASYCVVHLLDIDSKSLSSGKYIIKCLQQMCLENEKLFVQWEIHMKMSTRDLSGK